MALACGFSAGRGIVASMASKVTDFMKAKSWRMTTQKVTSVMQPSNRRDEGRFESSMATSPSSDSQRETGQKEWVGGTWGRELNVHCDHFTNCSETTKE
jgi:hypothetical protein